MTNTAKTVIAALSLAVVVFFALTVNNHNAVEALTDQKATLIAQIDDLTAENQTLAADLSRAEKDIAQLESQLAMSKSAVDVALSGNWGDYVYVSRSGSKYHSSSSCSNMKDPITMLQSDATASGYTACSRCY